MHLDLVEPKAPACSGCPSTLAPIASHVGGAAWAGKYLYVPDTNNGFRVFDLTWILRTTPKNFVLPQVAYFQQPASSSLNFSFASIDATGSKPVLVSGEYVDGGAGARIVRWPLSVDNKLRTDAGKVTSLEVLETRRDVLTNIQGVASRGSTYLLTRSRGADEPGTLYRGRPGEAADDLGPWLTGAEDLYDDIQGQFVWSLGEHQGGGQWWRCRRRASTARSS